MLKAIGSILDKLSGQSGKDASLSREDSLRLATALLLVEVARADYREDMVEDEAIVALLEDFFDLSDAEARVLIDQAREEADNAASLQSFTRQLHEELTVDEKLHVIEMLWRVALADDHLDKHEDHLVRKVAGLLYVSHGDLIRIRNRITDA